MLFELFINLKKYNKLHFWRIIWTDYYIFMKFSVLIKRRKKARLLFEVLYVLRVTTLKRKKFSGWEKNATILCSLSYC